ncbi:MAG: 2OG-Fe(II) oxygenase [Kiloniellaceae bacterium]
MMDYLVAGAGIGAGVAALRARGRTEASLIMGQTLADVVNLERYPLDSEGLRAECKDRLDQDGALVLRDFLTPSAIASIQREGEENRHLAYYTVSGHNIYLAPPDPDYPDDHPRNRQVTSSKGCIATDQVPAGSALHTLYDAPEFREFLCAVLDEAGLYEYADATSSINLHYAGAGQELGWHFDNSSFATTLMIQEPESGGEFEYVKDVRDADSGDMNYALSGKVLDGEVPRKTLSMDAGTLVLFRGRNSMHRVTPVTGHRKRMLVVLAYNTRPGIPLSESARMTFYGRLE